MVNKEIIKGGNFHHLKYKGLCLLCKFWGRKKSDELVIAMGKLVLVDCFVGEGLLAMTGVDGLLRRWRPPRNDGEGLLSLRAHIFCGRGNP